MWANADDLETLEFALFQLVSYIVGAVRLCFTSPRPFQAPYPRVRMQDIDPDLADDVRRSRVPSVRLGANSTDSFV
jgi:hypothetical protein